jgi:glycopeptide antibiotics resistance protein
MQRNRSFEVHAGWGAAIALACLLFGATPVLALFAACAAGVAVEAVQWAFPATGSATVKDAIYTGLGGLAGALLGVLA